MQEHISQQRINQTARSTILSVTSSTNQPSVLDVTRPAEGGWMGAADPGALEKGGREDRVVITPEETETIDGVEVVVVAEQTRFIEGYESIARRTFEKVNFVPYAPSLFSAVTV